MRQTGTRPHHLKDQSDSGRYASVNGLKMYYEVHGVSGKPLVLLHGAFGSIETDFGRILPALASNRKVIAIEQQAHAHTADIDRPLSYPQMAEDTAALLAQLRIEQADFLGYSMGGGISLQLAIRHPLLVRRFIFAGGASYTPEGIYPEMFETLRHMEPQDLSGSVYEQAYKKFAPNPDSWPALAAKLKQLDLTFTGWTSQELQSVKAPSLLIIGDNDIVLPEHTVEMFRLLGGGGPAGGPAGRHCWLAVLPGTSHEGLVGQLGWLLSIVTEFLEAPVSG